MIPWIQVYSNLPQHPKTSKLADELGLSGAALNPNAIAVGMVVSLWTWAVQNACNGDLSDCSPRAIAEACMWKKKPETLIKALKKAGFLGDDMKLHDWDDYTVMYQEMHEDSKEKHRERQRRYRERKKESVTVTSRGDKSDALPNITIHNQTNSFCGDGDGARACAREDVTQFCQERGLDPAALFGATPELIDEVRSFTRAMFDRFAARQPTEVDVGNVFRHIVGRNIRLPEPGGREFGAVCFIDTNARDLLLYAAETAANAGHGGNWNYIDGTLYRLQQRGIYTLQDAEDYDLERRETAI